MSEIKVINGGVFTDWRGVIAHVNELDMSEVARFYVIKQSDPEVVRAWHGHQTEKKWFYALRGSFKVAFVKVDDWVNPSPDLVPEVFRLSADESRILCIPEGYANGVKAEEPDSELLVFSNKILSVALLDSWRYDKDMWMDW